MPFPTFIKFSKSPQSEDNYEDVPIVKATVVVDVPAETRTVVSDEAASIVSSLSDLELMPSFRVHAWDKKSGYSDFIRDGLAQQNQGGKDVIMLFEAPSTSTSESSFFNSQVFKFHDYPPSAGATKAVLGPCRYSVMNGSSYPSFLRDGAPPAGLVDHWESTVPGFKRPSFVSEIPDSSSVYAYLPCESIKNHVNDPSVHYHLVGKDALHLMSKRTTKLLPNTRDTRPCVAKTTHSMGSKGIFVIRNDDDEAEFETFLAESGNPTFVITEYVEIERNAACHFFIHPNGDVTFLGCNENHRREDGTFSLDSYLIMGDQTHLKEIQLPFVRDVAQYCNSLGFWGFCGVDVLFDKSGRGYLVDVNPRVTGSCPALMVFQLLKDKYDYDFGLFRRSGDIMYYGPASELFERVKAHNEANDGKSIIVLFAVLEEAENRTKLNMGVYSHSLEVCQTLLNQFAKPKN